jgi:hypothetical protein
MASPPLSVSPPRIASSSTRGCTPPSEGLRLGRALVPNLQAPAPKPRACSLLLPQSGAPRRACVYARVSSLWLRASSLRQGLGVLSYGLATSSPAPCGTPAGRIGCGTTSPVHAQRLRRPRAPAVLHAALPPTSPTTPCCGAFLHLGQGLVHARRLGPSEQALPLAKLASERLSPVCPHHPRRQLPSSVRLPLPVSAPLGPCASPRWSPARPAASLLHVRALLRTYASSRSPLPSESHSAAPSQGLPRHAPADSSNAACSNTPSTTIPAAAVARGVPRLQRLCVLLPRGHAPARGSYCLPWSRS